MTTRFDFKKTFSKQHITENLGLKITALVVAVILWFIVVNITDPINTQSYKNVPVKIINSEIITGNNKTLEVVDDSSIIASVTIKAPRSVIQELGTSPDCIVATADMNKLSKDGVSVPIEFSTTKSSDKIENYRPSSDVLHVKVENRRTIQLPIKATTSGDIENGYILGNIIPNQNQVRVSGPESVVNRITNAKVDVQVTGFTGDISTQSDILFFDKNGDEIPSKNLDLNVESVRVDVEILATKKVPVYYSTIGIPAEGYAVTGQAECNPETVIIAGEHDIIDNISKITIPGEELNVTGQSANLYVVVDLNDFLPTGVRLADPTFNGKTSINIFIEPYVEDSFGVYLRNVNIVNVPEGFVAEFVESDDNIEFELSGLAQDLEKIKLSALNYRVDFDDYALLNDITEYKEGTYKLYLVMDLPSGVNAVETKEILVKLKKDTE